jgi:histidine kinase
MKMRVFDFAVSWRRISGEQIVGAALLGLAAIATPVIQMATGPFGIRWTELARIAINGEIWSFTLLGCIVVADDRVDRGVARVRAYGTAVVAAALIGMLLGAAHTHLIWDAFRNPSEVIIAKSQVNPWVLYTQQLYLVIEAILIGSLATYLYADRRETQKMAQRLHDASLRRAAQAKAMLESELQAMQARVEPRFLFNTLAKVQELYERDATPADRMLDDLIVYLRAAMPKLRDTSSTVGEELRLARAYLDILNQRFDDRLKILIDVPEDLADMRFPPMLLLPLIDHVVGHAQKQHMSLAVAVEQEGPVVRLRVRHNGVVFAPECARDGIVDIRERLYALYENRGRLVLCTREDHGTEAVLEIPIEPRRLHQGGEPRRTSIERSDALV